MHMVSAVYPAPEDTLKWDHEITLAIDKDMREPFLLEMNGTLRFFFFEAGVNPVGFDPARLLRIQRKGKIFLMTALDCLKTFPLKDLEIGLNQKNGDIWERWCGK